MNYNQIINWLLTGDVAIQYQVHKDLLGKEISDLKSRIESEGWGKNYLSLRNNSGHWGRGFYQPKWTSTHYTVLDLKNLGISENCSLIKETLEILIKNEKGPDGGMNPSTLLKESDVCINGMALNYFSYFKTPEIDLRSIIDFLLSQHMPDGGFNCHSNRKGAKHSSLHTTLSVLEGMYEYKKNHYSYRIKDIFKAEKECIEFILMHKLFKSDKTGKIIRNDFLKLTYPPRWKYNILRALDYFRMAEIPYDDRMKDAFDVILKKRNNDNTWNLQAHHPGHRHFEMEEVGKPSRWNTLNALRVLKKFNTEPIQSL